MSVSRVAVVQRFKPKYDVRVNITFRAPNLTIAINCLSIKKIFAESLAQSGVAQKREVYY